MVNSKNSKSQSLKKHLKRGVFFAKMTCRVCLNQKIFAKIKKIRYSRVWSFFKIISEESLERFKLWFDLKNLDCMSKGKVN
jgi:hypothetical protein